VKIVDFKFLSESLSSQHAWYCLQAIQMETIHYWEYEMSDNYYYSQHLGDIIFMIPLRSTHKFCMETIRA
jgi:hypothetical protein